MKFKDGSEVSLSSHAARMNIQLLKASDFNEKLHQKGCSREVSVQKICQVARDEKEVREVLDQIWKDPPEAEDILSNVQENNEDLYEFERKLKSSNS